ncbi:MAG: hypothetical protein QM796_09355, partial [Chthoniobacteraceae bacterium]
MNRQFRRDPVQRGQEIDRFTLVVRYPAQRLCSGVLHLHSIAVPVHRPHPVAIHGNRNRLLGNHYRARVRFDRELHALMLRQWHRGLVIAEEEEAGFSIRTHVPAQDGKVTQIDRLLVRQIDRHPRQGRAEILQKKMLLSQEMILLPHLPTGAKRGLEIVILEWQL